MVVAATVVSQGLSLSTVDASGPLLPPAADTNTPAAAALKNASWSGSVAGVGVLPPIE
ncbi:hypothetical protein GCM10022403_052910 [Streptomyces coacervatus]|uniref:Secreted protein n=1 Tax=Streptomyces coacervatus TaxID=647381 RepID=A0ABP7I970_9ACTN